MARIRAVEIRNFRCIREFSWRPSPGINCLIGPGDCGKSTVLEAIDLCLGARRSIQFCDTDFHQLDLDTPISIEVTIGELSDSLKSLDSYGMFLRGFHLETGIIEDEPEKTAETVLTIALEVGSDLEPSWSLMSERAAAQDQVRTLAWADRARVSPTRVDAIAYYHLGWRRGSVLNRLSEERPDASAALAKAARDARAAFGDEANKQLEGALETVALTAKELGVPVGDAVKAMLDAYSVSFSGGTISLHDNDGVPLSGLGAGSTRLLIAGLQRKAASQSSVILIDELEYGLEPHRIIRLLDSLGSKERLPPLQVFVSTHSPVAVRELSGTQLFVLRVTQGKHEALSAGASSIQGTIRLFPESFLASVVFVCEGASEVGLLRGLDHYRASTTGIALGALGVALIDGAGADNVYMRADAFQTLGYPTAIVRDDDVQPDLEAEKAFKRKGGKVVTWQRGRTLEDELFLSLSESAVEKLLERAIDLHGETLIDDHIRSASNGELKLSACKGSFSPEIRSILGQASRTKKAGWFKSVTAMQGVASEIAAPDLPYADVVFRELVETIFDWAKNAGA